MNKNSATFKTLLLLFYSLLALFICSCNKKDQESVAKIVLEDKPISGTQKKLLDIAIEAATSIPVDPHIKDRSRVQEQVVMTCIELDQPQRSRIYINKIDNWRRNLCYANLGLYCAKHGKTNEAKYFLKIASDFSMDSQDWRLVRIKEKASQGYRVIGQLKQAEKVIDSIDEKTDKYELVQAKRSFRSEKSFNKQVETLDKIVGDSSDFDKTITGLDLYTELYDETYTNSNEKQRDIIEEKIKSSWTGVPNTARMNVLIDMTEHSLNNSDRDTALRLVNEAWAILQNSHLSPDIHMFTTGKLIELRFKSGDTEKAKSDAEVAMDYFEKNYDLILNIYRAGTLRPLAQAYQAIEDTQGALSVYKRAVEEGVVNPNSRPRAEDLSANCCSMAVSGFEPDAELWLRINQIKEGLGDPW